MAASGESFNPSLTAPHQDQQAQSSTSSSTSPSTSTFLQNVSNAKGFSSNPRWKRHASLDAGVFRARINSLVSGNLSAGPHTANSLDTPISYYDFDEATTAEEKRLLMGYTPTPSRNSFGPLSPLGFPLSPGRKKKKALWSWIPIAVGGTVLVVLMVWTAKGHRPTRKDLGKLSSVLEEYGIPSFASVQCDNPYMEYGHLTVDQKTPENNRWLPYDPLCTTPELMASIRKHRPSSSSSSPLTFPIPRPSTHPKNLELPWLHGKTVLLLGDHIERLHNKDFCNFAGGTFVSIEKDHPISPPSFRNGIDEKLAGSEKESDYTGSRPAVCYVEEYDLTMVSVFHYGLATRVEFEHEDLWHDKHFYPPVAIDDRISHIVLPLLHSIGRPHPDLIEYSSGFWDLRHFTALDEKEDTDPFSDLSADRLQWYADRLTASLQNLSTYFPGTAVLWRSLHHTPKYNKTPFARVAALDQLARKVIAVTNKARRRGKTYVDPPKVTKEEAKSAAGKKTLGGVGGGGYDHDSVHAPFLNRVKDRIDSSSSTDGRVTVSPGGHGNEKYAAGEIRIDPWGSLMLGQENLMNGYHTPPLPGGFLWGDIILYELKQAVEKDAW